MAAGALSHKAVLGCRKNLHIWLVWYFFLFDSIWQVVQIGICPWNTKNALWVFVEMLEVLWLLSHLHCHNPSALPAHGALQRSHSLLLCISSAPAGFVCRIAQFSHIQASVQMSACTARLFASSF